MKRWVFLGAFIVIVTAVQAAKAEDADNRLYVFGNKTRVVHTVISAQPIFDGTGYASEKHLAYRSTGGSTVVAASCQGDYYRAIREAP